MKIRLQIRKQGTPLFDGVYDVTDPESFGRACADSWIQLRSRRLGRTTSVGEFMDTMNQNILDELQGADISLTKA